MNTDTLPPAPEILRSSCAIPTRNCSDRPYSSSRCSRVMAESNNVPATVAASPAIELSYVQYDGAKEEQYLPSIRQLISKDLSEPYSIYVYRYFLYQWGDLCFMVSQKIVWSSTKLADWYRYSNLYSHVYCSYPATPGLKLTAAIGAG